MQLTAVISLFLTTAASAALLNSSSKLDINQKVYIEGAPVLGDGAGEGLLGICTRFADSHISNAAAPTIKLCGTGITMQVHVRNRCEAYTKDIPPIGDCNTALDPGTCVTVSPSTAPNLAHSQSYLITQCK